MTLEFLNVTVPTGQGQMLTGLSFVAEEGRLTCIVGRGGRSVLRAAMGLAGVEGSVSIDGEPVTRLSAPWLRRYMAYVPKGLEPVGSCPCYEPPTPNDVFTLRANRGVQGGGSLFEIAEQLDKPIVLVDNDEASPQWLQGMARKGKTVVLATTSEQLAAAADSVVRLE